MPKFLSSIDLDLHELKNLVLQKLASNPSSPVEAWLYENTADHTIRFHNGSFWISLGTLDQITAPGGDVTINGHKLTNVQDGTNPQDAVTVAMLTAAIAAFASGISWKDSVRAASFTNGTLATAFANGQTVGGVVVATGNRILLGGQTAGQDNGIYIVNATGAPTRAADANTSGSLQGAFVPVDEGDYAGKQFYLATDNITLGTTPQVWSEFIPPSTKYSQDVGDGSTVDIVVTHNLGNRDVGLTLRLAASPYSRVECDWEATGINTVTLHPAVAPTTAQYRAVVHG